MPDPVDRARLLDEVRVSPDVRSAVNLVDLHRTAIVQQAVPPLTGPRGTARVRIDRPAHIVVETSAAGVLLLPVGLVAVARPKAGA
jgi:hypothetical protein